jgi:hypothetical protein
VDDLDDDDDVKQASPSLEDVVRGNRKSTCNCPGGNRSEIFLCWQSSSSAGNRIVGIPLLNVVLELASLDTLERV